MLSLYITGRLRAIHSNPPNLSLSSTPSISLCRSCGLMTRPSWSVAHLVAPLWPHSTAVTLRYRSPTVRHLCTSQCQRNSLTLTEHFIGSGTPILAIEVCRTPLFLLKSNVQHCVPKKTSDRQRIATGDAPQSGGHASVKLWTQNGG